MRKIYTHQYLHSNMYLLIRQLDDVQALLDDNLHSNMYLLIPGMLFLKRDSSSFTFQHVSINSSTSVRGNEHTPIYIPTCIY